MDSAERTGVILAAGLGSRLRGAAELKPLVPVAGTPVIFRAMRGLELAGCERIVIVTGHRGDELRRGIERGYAGAAAVSFVDNPRYRLRNGVSLLCAADHVGEVFVLTMADHVVGDEVMKLAGAHDPAAGGATLLVDYRVDAIFDLDDATKVSERSGQVVKIGKELDDYNCVDTGVFVCTRGLLTELARVLEDSGDASLSEGVAGLAERGRMHVLDIGDGFWQDVDTPEMLAFADKALQDG